MEQKPRLTAQDWTEAERAYRVNTMSLREISGRWGVSRSAIIKHMAKRGIERDQSANIAVAAKAAVARDIAAVSARGAGGHPMVGDVVTAVAEVQASVVKRHRISVGRLMGNIDQLAGELGELAMRSERGAVLMQRLLTCGDTEVVDMAKAEGPMLMRALLAHASLGNRLELAEQMARTYKAMIPLERQAHGIDDKGGEPDDSFESLLERAKPHLIAMRARVAKAEDAEPAGG